MMDNKTRQMALGIGGAFCLCCLCSKADTKDEAKTQAGFPMNRSLEQINEVFERLAVENEDSDDDDEMYIPSRTGDYGTRFGGIHKPITEQDLCQDLSPVHCRLRCWGFILNIIYRLNSGIFKWGGIGTRNERWTEEEKQIYKNQKKIFKAKVKGACDIQVDMPAQGMSSGSTDTGNNVKRLMEKENRTKIIDLCMSDRVTDDEKAGLHNLMQKLSIILRVVNSGQKIETDAYSQFCIDTNLEIIRNFPWAELSMVAHITLAHTAERIVNNDGFGLKNLSESGLEGLHKVLRMVRRDLSRKNSLENEIEDVLKYMWVQSDPTVRESKRRLECSNCQARNHTKRGCPELKINPVWDEDDDIINRFFLD